MSKRRRICVVTHAHLSTCPRMLKAADALAGAGYDVRVISTRYVGWATATDIEVRRTRSAWRWTELRFDDGSPARLYTALRVRVARAGARQIGPARYPLALAARVLARFHSELERAILAEPADLIYGGTGCVPVAVASAARRMGVPFALDLEDFHPCEHPGAPDGELLRALVDRIERAVLPRAAFLTAGSDAIAVAYMERYGLQPIAINNTFALPSVSPALEGSTERLRLYWFSQTVGPERGLEDVVDALGRLRVDCELHLRGRPLPGYETFLKQRVRTRAPNLLLTIHHPLPPDLLVESCRGYDVGLALEPGRSRFNALMLTNKACTYILAGLAVAITDTPGQRPLAQDLGNGALVFAPGDIDSLASGLARWGENRELLRSARQSAWQAACRRWHWEHPRERGALLQAVAQVID